MESDHARRVFLELCREFLTTSTNMTREAIGRKQDAVNASMARVALSAETIRRSEERLVRCEQRIINAEIAWNQTRAPS
jgi:hypothetical protein